MKKGHYHCGLECLHCGVRLFSRSRHDYRTCKCVYPLGIMVDGGHSYFRFGWANGWVKGKDYKIIREKYYETTEVS
jgi:hypothetical protein